MSHRTQLRMAFSLLLVVLVVGGYLVLRGNDWAVGAIAVFWLVFMVWAARFKCRRCRTLHLFEVSGLMAHPMWPGARCRTCGLSLAARELDAPETDR